MGTKLLWAASTMVPSTMYVRAWSTRRSPRAAFQESFGSNMFCRVRCAENIFSDSSTCVSMTPSARRVTRIIWRTNSPSSPGYWSADGALAM